MLIKDLSWGWEEWVIYAMPFSQEISSEKQRSKFFRLREFQNKIFLSQNLSNHPRILQFL